jgi:hypothetical protein
MYKLILMRSVNQELILTLSAALELILMRSVNWELILTHSGNN